MFLIAVVMGSFTLFFTGKGWSTVISDARSYASQKTADKALADVAMAPWLPKDAKAYVAQVGIKA